MYFLTLLFYAWSRGEESPRSSIRESDSSELDHVLKYYSLVREGNTNYVSTTAFRDVTGSQPLEPPQFFEAYVEEFQPKQANKKRKTNANGHENA